MKCNYKIRQDYHLHCQKGRIIFVRWFRQDYGIANYKDSAIGLAGAAIPKIKLMLKSRHLRKNYPKNFEITTTKKRPKIVEISPLTKQSNVR